MTASRDPQFLDDLAHVMRRHWSGQIRPLWCDLPSDIRAMRCDAAERFVSFLEANGFTIQRLTTKTKDIQDAGHNDPA